jgi:anti-sigma-K factor RskA
MSERNMRKEREALIAGDDAASLRPEEAADVSLLADLLADPSTWAEPRPELEDSVLDAVMMAPAEPANVVPMRRRAGGSGWWRAAVAAAAGIVIVVGAFVVTRGGSDPDFESELAATELAPMAGGSVDITQNAGGFRVTLDARGLPPLPAGEYYQAWLKDASGTLVAIGTFSTSDDIVTLWSGVSPADFPTMTVTIESADGEQASSGRVVLAGQVRSG